MSLLSSRRQADLSRLEGQIDPWSEKSPNRALSQKFYVDKNARFLGVILSHGNWVLRRPLYGRLADPTQPKIRHKSAYRGIRALREPAQ